MNDPTPSPAPPRASRLRDLRVYADLRRAHDPFIADILRDRARVLPLDERAALNAVVFQGEPVTHVASLTGERPRTLRRRMRRLLRRVLAPEFAFVTAHASRWGPTRRQIAEHCFVKGESIRACARSLNIPLYQVRRHHESIRAMVELARAGVA